MDSILREAVRLQEAGRAGAMVVVTAVKGHTPQVVGARMLVLANGSIHGTIGGGRVEHEVVRRALAALDAAEPATHTFNLKAELGMCCGGSMTVFIEPLVVAERLVIFGAGHVAMETAAAAARVGFHPVIVDERPDWNSEERFPAASRRAVEPYEDFLDAFAFRPTDYVVVTTHNHDHDRDILQAVLRTDVGYVGMIGSVRKVDKTRKLLRLAGLDEASLDRAHAPVGLDIFAETPAEIAVSIVGELIRHRRAPRSKKTTRGAAVTLLSAPAASSVAEESVAQDPLPGDPVKQRTA